eukprot:TRINITY_DN10232_c0_g1_i5.p2 TRINITY_DN10232_c0_g1~~TRINITY_DN10232_c0_g1_i5.p2  ORF type:complete len:123 (+),score=31.38 TRINITY_DN10232_c0_g1_i5:1145-1513(+)
MNRSVKDEEGDAKFRRLQMRGRNSILASKSSQHDFRIVNRNIKQCMNAPKTNKELNRNLKKPKELEENNKTQSEYSESTLDVSGMMKEVNVCKEDSVPLFPALGCNYKDTAEFATPDIIFII